MITQNRYDLGDMSFQGLSTDTKPTLAPVNSLFLELDTKTLYYCAKTGSQSEEVMFEGQIDVEETYYGTIDADAFKFGDPIIVQWGDKTYTCPKRFERQDGHDIPTWGAPLVETEEGGMDHDYSVFPFVISADSKTTVEFESSDNIPSSITITSLVTTEAEWVKYGEAPSGGGITGNLADGLTISPSAWSVDRNLASVSVPYYAISSGEAYTLRMGADSASANGMLNERDRSVSLSYFDGDFVITSKPSDQTTRIVVATDEIVITEDLSVSLTYSPLS